MSATYFQKGLGLAREVGPVLATAYDSRVVDRIRELGHVAAAGSFRLRLAREFGFCYGVDRAVDYAYQTRHRFPERKIFLSGEIIHNPDVNGRLRQLGVEILPDGPPTARYGVVQPEDVVILPAFGVTVAEQQHLREKGCVLVDTTCGSVLNVWKNVHRYAREGFTAVIHGKHHHEETRATASQASTYPGGRYLVVRDLEEAGLLCRFVRGEATAEELLARLGPAASPGFVPEQDLQRIGLANQTTMLMSESLKVQEMLRGAMLARWGESELPARFRAFDTICSATQDRQDAVLEMLDEGGLDLMIVIGGYNSSNTQALTRICAERLPAFHIATPENLGAESIRHLPVGGKQELETRDWLPEGPVSIGLTAGASTPNRVVGEVVGRLLALRGLRPEQLAAAA